jgi:hypothetical protein
MELFLPLFPMFTQLNKFSSSFNAFGYLLAQPSVRFHEKSFSAARSECHLNHGLHAIMPHPFRFPFGVG